MNDDEITIVGGDSIFFGDNQQSQSTGYTPIKPSLNPRSKLPANTATNKGVFVPQYRETTNFIPKTTPTTPYVPHVPKVSSQTPYTPYVPHVPHVQNTFVPETNFNTSNTQQQQHQTSFIPTPETHQQQQQNSPFIPNMNAQNTPFVPVMPLRQQTPSNIGNGMANNDPLNFNKVPEVLNVEETSISQIISITISKKDE